jgi:hypothetical protein
MGGLSCPEMSILQFGEQWKPGTGVSPRLNASAFGQGDIDDGIALTVHYMEHHVLCVVGSVSPPVTTPYHGGAYWSGFAWLTTRSLFAGRSLFTLRSLGARCAIFARISLRSFIACWSLLSRKSRRSR